MRFFIQQDAMEPRLRGYGSWRRVPSLHAYSTCPIPFNVVLRCLYIAWTWMRGPFPYYYAQREYWEQRARDAEGGLKAANDALGRQRDRIRALRVETKRGVDIGGRRARIAQERLDVLTGNV